MMISLLAKATAIRVQQCDAALATIGFDIGHTSSATPASTSVVYKITLYNSDSGGPPVSAAQGKLTVFAAPCKYYIGLPHNVFAESYY